MADIPTGTGAALSPLASNPAAQQAAREYEAVIAGEFTKIMMETVPEDSLGGGGHAMGIYREMFSQTLGQAIAARGGLGIAPAVMAEMIRMQSGEGR